VSAFKRFHTINPGRSGSHANGAINKANDGLYL